MKAESLVEFGSCRNLPAVLTLVPLHTTPLCQPCCSESAFPKTRFQGWAQFILQTLLPPAGGGLDPEQEESAHSQCRVGMLETGAKCLWEYQLVPGADCRQKEQEGESIKVYNYSATGAWGHNKGLLFSGRREIVNQCFILIWLLADIYGTLPQVAHTTASCSISSMLRKITGTRTFSTRCIVFVFPETSKTSQWNKTKPNPQHSQPTCSWGPRNKEIPELASTGQPSFCVFLAFNIYTV